MSEETTKKKKGFFSKLTDLVYETPEEANQDNISVSNSGGDLESSPIEATAAPINIQTSGDGVFDEKFNQIFQDLIAENNIPGIDYFEFKQAIQGMAGVAGLNEAASFKTAFTTLKVSDPNLTKETLMSSIDVYIKLLNEEENEFNTAIQEKTANEVDARRKQAADLTAENEALVKQIQDINAKIADNQNKTLELNNEAAHEEAQIGQTVKNFVKTLAHVQAGLETDKTKIEQLIQE